MDDFKQRGLLEFLKMYNWLSVLFFIDSIKAFIEQIVILFKYS